MHAHVRFSCHVWLRLLARPQVTHSSHGHGEGRSRPFVMRTFPVLVPRLASCVRGVEQRASSPSIVDATHVVASTCRMRNVHRDNASFVATWCERHGRILCGTRDREGCAAEDVVSHEEILATRTADPRRSTTLLPPAVRFDDWRNEIFARWPWNRALLAEESRTISGVVKAKFRLPLRVMYTSRFPLRSCFFFHSGGWVSISYVSNRSSVCPPRMDSHRRGCTSGWPSCPRKGWIWTWTVEERRGPHGPVVEGVA